MTDGDHFYIPFAETAVDKNKEKADHFTEEEITLIFEAFRHHDVRKEGRIDIKLVPKVMLTLGHNPTRHELEQLMNSIDGDKQAVDFPEFLTILAFHTKDAEPEEDLRQAFKIFDKDGNGRINATELQFAMNTLGEHLSDDEVEFMIKMADVTGDGQVNYEEFIRVMVSKW